MFLMSPGLTASNPAPDVDFLRRRKIRLDNPERSLTDQLDNVLHSPSLVDLKGRSANASLIEVEDWEIQLPKSTPSLMDSALKIADIRQSVQYVNVASLAVLVYDYFQTLELEVELVWKSSWSISKVVFLLARYPTFVDVPLILYYTLNQGMSYDTCSVVNAVTSWSTAVGIGMAEVILLLRTYALWNNSRKVLIALIVLYISIYTPVVVVLAIFLRSLQHGAPPLPIIRGCYPVSGSNILFADFVLLMLYESTVMVLTIWIGVKRYLHSRNRLVMTLYRDGVSYFIYIFMISCSYIIVLLACPPEYVDLLNTFQRVMHSILSTRILLHVRDTARAQTSFTFPIALNK
ncbi:hypothetical protein BDZ94DRAFT_1320782 [Collybia nuda]|uniref:DUF6533 domain-containing protein n=1 Tax=Collybia nuda TaxID=64659 RepID=A0A9P6CGC3_9AGAR|nr:hypothetical protein BDZ94DRAFT_1320782 [Collybia nuda]